MTTPEPAASPARLGRGAAVAAAARPGAGSPPAGSPPVGSVRPGSPPAASVAAAPVAAALVATAPAPAASVAAGPVAAAPAPAASVAAASVAAAPAPVASVAAGPALASSILAGSRTTAALAASGKAVAAGLGPGAGTAASAPTTRSTSRSCKQEQVARRPVHGGGLDGLPRDDVDDARGDAQAVSLALVVARDQPRRARESRRPSDARALPGRGDVEVDQPRQGGPQRLDDAAADPVVAGGAAVGEARHGDGARRERLAGRVLRGLARGRQRERDDASCHGSAQAHPADGPPRRPRPWTSRPPGSPFVA